MSIVLLKILAKRHFSPLRNRYSMRMIAFDSEHHRAILAKQQNPIRAIVQLLERETKQRENKSKSSFSTSFRILNCQSFY